MGPRSRSDERSVEKVVVSLQYLILQVSTDRGSCSVKFPFAPRLVRVEAATAVCPRITKISGKTDRNLVRVKKLSLFLLLF